MRISVNRRWVATLASGALALGLGTADVFAEEAPGRVTAPTGMAALQPLVGFWFVAAKDAVIELSPCAGNGNAGGAPVESARFTLCGRIAWIRDPVDAEGNLRRDVKNPDRTMRNNPLCGSAVLWGLAADPKRAGRWRDGKAYIATRGLRVNPRVDLVDPNSIRVRGSIGPFGQTEVWTRADPAASWKCAG